MLMQQMVEFLEWLIGLTINLLENDGQNPGWVFTKKNQGSKTLNNTMH